MNRRKTILALTVGLAAVGLLWRMGHQAVGGLVTARFGNRLAQMAAGKFTDARHFVDMRLRDLALLAAGACALGLVHLAVSWLLNRKVPARYHWVGGAVSGFLCLNVFALLAGHTAVYWCALFSGAGRTPNYTQYEIKSNLMKEMKTPQAVLVGNSQTRAQIDEGQVNDRLGKRLWTTELHFPGSRTYDTELAFRKIPEVDLKFAVCYLSEGYFFSGVDSPGLMYFQNWGDLPEFERLGGGNVSMGQDFRLGLLGAAIPLFRMRESLADRLLGHRLMNLAQEHYNGALDVDLTQRAAEAARGYHRGPETEFEKRGLAALAQSCRQRGCRLVLCVGQNNPIFGRALPRSMRVEMDAYLRELAGADPNVVLLDEAEMPKQTEADYDDLTHVNTAAQARFSAYIAGVLEKLMENPGLAQTR